ncbi:MAG TPA: methyltransferase domain-containing protein [Thermoanaerobaculia bacterium]|nr:methyltransferase domain-containing protein [Thermoanaerobaculia bacterium]
MASIGYFQALALIRRTYAGAPAATRMHVLVRFVTCPFLRVLDFLPPKARLLDLGAGHAIFSHLALAAGARSAVALEPDRRKVFHAFPSPGMRIVAGTAGALRGLFDAVAILDVLYRLPRTAWDPLLREVRGLLAPGGVLLLKEQDPGHRLKACWNRAQEWLVDRAGLTLGEAFSYEPREEVRRRLLAAGFASCEAVGIGRGYPHAHVLYIARVAAG